MEQARIWLSIKADDTWHALNHAPRRVAAGELEANCTKNESWDLQESHMPGPPNTPPTTNPQAKL